MSLTYVCFLPISAFKLSDGLAQTLRVCVTSRCRVVGITLSKEQKALAEERAKAKGVDHLVSFQIIDYRCSM